MSSFINKFWGSSSTSQTTTGATSTSANVASNTASTPRELSHDSIQTMEEDQFTNIQKSAVIHESRCFNDRQISVRECRKVLSKLVYLTNQGEKFLESESTNIFFAVTKLFQSTDQNLRRIIYLFIKEMQHEPSIYIITESLRKDMNDKIDLFRMNALRLAPVILESQYLIQSERYIKNAIIDKNPAVAISALLAGIHLFPENVEFVRKWSNEIQEKLNSSTPETHYHALILLREIKRQDKNALLKVILNLCKDGKSGNLAAVQLIRIIKEMVLQGEIDQQNEKELVDYLDRALQRSSEMVSMEAAKALCEFKTLPNRQLVPAVSTLSFFLSSQGSVNRFAALRIINKLISNPSRIPLIENNTDLENLIRENNTSFNAFTISILLKISKEEGVDELLGKIQDSIAESSEEFKIDIVSSVKALAKKHPKKYRSIVNFFSHCLKNEGQYEFKSACVSCLEYVLKEIPESKEIGLFTLAEFIEDCQYPSLHIQIMNLLAREAGNVANPAKFVRLIYNRFILEDSNIRATAISTLGKFALEKHSLIGQIRKILETALEDNDHEVRARAMFYLDEMNRIQTAGEEEFLDSTLSPNELDSIEAFLQRNIEEVQRTEDSNVLDIDHINQYIKDNKIQVQKQETKKKGAHESAVDLDNAASVERRPEEDATFKKYQQLFAQNTEFEDIGDLRLLHEEKAVTDPNSEYLVKVRKIFFDEYLVLEFSVKNTLDSQVLCDVNVDLQFDTDDLKVMQVISLKQIKSGETGSVFITVAKNPEFKMIMSNVQGFLKFKVQEFSGNTKTAEYDDEYQLEDFTINVSDYLRPTAIPVDKKFDSVWKTMQGEEQKASYELEYKTLEAAIKGLIKHFGMYVCESSDVINLNNKTHSLMLAGTYLGYVPLLLNAVIGFQQGKGCVMVLKSKSVDEGVAAGILDCVN